MTRAHYISRSRKPLSAWIAVAATLSAALAVLLLPSAPDSASVWAPLVALFPESARSCFALAVASCIGCIAWQAAEAVAQRRAVRPALTAAIVSALLAPVAAPLWAALFAAAALLALPAPVRLVAANDNERLADRWVNPFALAA